MTLFHYYLWRFLDRTTIHGISIQQSASSCTEQHNTRHSPILANLLQTAKATAPLMTTTTNYTQTTDYETTPTKYMVRLKKTY